MCILIAAWRHHPRYDLVVAANRDEFHTRPARAAAAWPELPRLVAGRDLEAGGTWLGVSADGRFAAVTNVRHPARASGARSRGLLVSDYLGEPVAAAEYATGLPAAAGSYAGVNMLLADGTHLYAWSNRDNRPDALPTGVYGLSNAALDVEWPKVRRLKAAYERRRALEEDALIAGLLETLADDSPPPDAELPDTGVGLAAERMLAPIFIRGDAYGTRCSSVVLREATTGRVIFVERRFDAQGRPCGESRHELLPEQ
jgi:uncharacterized protein with NRDE domain